MGIRSRNVDDKGGRQTGLGLYQTFYLVGTGPVSGNEAAIVAAVVPDTTAGATKELTIAAQPDTPRTLNCEVSTDADADLTAKFDIRGITSYGERVHETVSGVTLAGGAVETVYAYRQVDSIIVTTDTTADVDAADRVRVGWGPSHGSPVRLAATTDVVGAYERVQDPGTPTDWVKLTVVTSGLGTGEVLVDVTYHTLEFGDVPATGQEYLVNIQSTADLSEIDMASS